MKQLRGVDLGNLLFIDTETARLQKDLKEGTADFEAWEYMVKRKADSGEIDVRLDYLERAGLYAEFSKLVCISVGYISKGELMIASYKGDNEKELLSSFMANIDIFLKSKPDARLVGHSVKGFDIPFIFRRSLVNGVCPNRLIDVGGLKPWDLTALDTKELWKGTGYYSSSLVAVCLALGIPSPKSDITGAEVGDVYHNEGAEGLERIAEYCERDVMAVANIVKACRFEKIFDKYTKVEPKERGKMGLLERIGKTGIISGVDKDEILRKVAGADEKEKEKLIKLLKAALLLTKKELSKNLELEILRA